MPLHLCHISISKKESLILSFLEIYRGGEDHTTCGKRNTDIFECDKHSDRQAAAGRVTTDCQRTRFCALIQKPAVRLDYSYTICAGENGRREKQLCGQSYLTRILYATH